MKTKLLVGCTAADSLKSERSQSRRAAHSGHVALPVMKLVHSLVQSKSHRSRDRIQHRSHVALMSLSTAACRRHPRTPCVSLLVSGCARRHHHHGQSHIVVRSGSRLHVHQSMSCYRAVDNKKSSKKTRQPAHRCTSNPKPEAQTGGLSQHLHRLTWSTRDMYTSHA